MKKRILYSVMAAHLVMIFWMVMWTPVKKEKPKSLKIHTVIKTPPPPLLKEAIVQAKTVPKPVSVSPPVKKKAPAPVPPKKVATTAKQTKKTTPVSQELQKQLQESIAKFSENSHKECPKATLEVPKHITRLEMDAGVATEENAFAAALIECLQQTLKLPERGAVKVELTLKQDGTFVNLHVSDAQSQRNAFFLEEQLPMIHYPRFTGSLKQEKEHTFVISFCHF